MIVHEELAEYSGWLRLIFFIPVGLIIGAILLVYNGEYEAFYILIAEGAFFILLFYFIMPRKYQIYQDRLRIVLGEPFGINIPLSTIKEVKYSSGIKAFVFSGIRFATSIRNVVEILRNRGSNYVISPQNSEIFITKLEQAMRNQANNR